MIYIIGILCLSYISLSKRVFDFYSVAIISSLFYFIPSFFGYVWYIDRGIDLFYDVSPSVLFIHGTVLLMLVFGAFINDIILNNRIYYNTIYNDYSIVRIFYFSSMASFVIFLIFNFGDVLQGFKQNYGSLYSITSTSIVYSIILSAIRRDWRWFSAFSLSSLIILYSGNREIIAFSSIGIITILMSGKGKIVLSRYYKYVLIFLIPFSILVFYKGIGAAVIAGESDLIISRITDPEYYISSIMKTEPFIVQSTLLFSIEGGWSYGGHYFSNMISLMVPFYGYFFGDVDTAGAFLNSKFGDVGYGIASNLWAEAYVVGRWPLVFIFSLIYSYIPFVLNKIYIRFRFDTSRSLVVVIGAIVLFYMHRAGAEMGVLMCVRMLLFYFSLKAFYRVVRLKRS